MALLKEKILENGITVNYHRIVSLVLIVNNQNIIEVASYTSKIKREEEKDVNNEKKDVYINTNYYNLDYDEEMNIEKAYEYLKKLEEFSDAKDV